MPNPTIALTGRLTGDPELRFGTSGFAITGLSIATSDRKKNGEQWEDVDTSFWRCTAFRQLAEAAAEQLHKGMAVVAVGRIKQTSWEKDGQKRTGVEVVLESIGPDLRWAKPAGTSVPAPAAADPWAAAPAQTEPPW